MSRDEIIELIRNTYDPTPSHLPPNSGWDDGTGAIADKLRAELAAVQETLERTVSVLAEARSGYISGSGPDIEWNKSRDAALTDASTALQSQRRTEGEK